MYSVGSNTSKNKETKDVANVEDQKDLNCVNASSIKEAPESSKSTEPKSKRQRTAQATKPVNRKKRVQGGQGKPIGLTDVPTEVLTEIALRLMPGDIVMLARVNKFFRSLLMRRSAAYVWRGAMQNLPQLPACPPNMCEPHYLSLIYCETCSLCGNSAFRRMDGALCVRLCKQCSDKSTVLRCTLPLEIRDLVNYSFHIVATTFTCMNDWVLRREVDSVTTELEAMKKSQSDSAIRGWKQRRKEDLSERRLWAGKLQVFFKFLDSEQQAKLDGQKAERRSQIKQNLVDLGFDAKDFHSNRSNEREWNRMVEQPKPLSDRTWKTIRPKLVPIIEANQAARLAREKVERKQEKDNTLARLLAGLENARPPLIETQIINPCYIPSSRFGASTTKVTHHHLFPALGDILECPIVKHLNGEVVSATEMETRFKEHREEIVAFISAWTSRVEEHMAGILCQGRLNEGLPEKAPVPVLPVARFHPDPFVGVSDVLKPLLRADSLFEPTSNSFKPMSYATVIRSWHASIRYTDRERPLELAKFKLHAEGQAFARVFLKQLGKPDACFLEFQVDELKFQCGRCIDHEFHSWEEIIQHYIDEKQHWEKIQERLSVARKMGLSLKFNDVHALDRNTKKPFIRLGTMNQLCGGMPSESDYNTVCKLCERLGSLPFVNGSNSQVFEHLSEVHDVTKPKPSVHYKKFRTFGADGGGMYDSDDYLH
ncbi:hypothetical protein BDV93DRAFT_527716 [Ceratobasidium sp. AG-I]|nr:hypothetical protein BDV93DRAFT_527716 [Ceratobasidium sp. AG-I]